MKKLWYKLAKNNIGTTEMPIQNPQVWVSETHTYNEALDRLEIKWRLSVEQVQAQVLLVNIYHSSIATGATENHVWQLPTGQSYVEGQYNYPLANVSNVSELKFGIVAGEGYSIPNTAQRPNEVVVNIAAATVVTTVPTVLDYEPFNALTALQEYHHQRSTTYGFTVVPTPEADALQDGSTVGRWELRKGDAEVSGGTRTEVLFSQAVAPAETWHGFAAYFPSADYAVDSISYDIINQWHPGFTVPTLLLRIKNGRYIMYRDGETETNVDLGPQLFDQWVNFVIHLKQHVSAGFMKIWINDVLVYNVTGKTMGSDFTQPARWKVGIYKSDWNEGGTWRPTNSTKRVWYIDELRIADSTGTYATVDPKPRQGVTPAAPTNGVVNDSVNTFSFSLVPGYTTNQHQYSLNGGTTWVTCTSTVIQIGNVNKAVGDIRVRVKALFNNPAGNQLYNAEPFTETIPNSGGNVPATYNNPLPMSYSAPITITQGGTYTFNVESTDVNVDAVTITTSQEVILLNCNIKGRRWGINALLSHRGGGQLRLKVLNCRHYGGAVGSVQRRFIEADNIANLVVENCYMESSAGIKVAGLYVGNGTTSETIKIRYNQALNIDGRTQSGSVHSQFFQCAGLRTSVVYKLENGINFYQGIKNMEVAWNKVINLPGLSHVEDNVNIYNSRGHTASPISIHNNYVHGAYYAAWQGNEYSGSGMIADSPGADRGVCTAYVNFHRNLVIMSNGASFGIAGGNNIKFTECVGIGKGFLNSADASRLGMSGAGKELKGYPAGIYVTDARYNKNATYDNLIDQLTEGVVGQDSISLGYWRNDLTDSRNAINAAWATVTNLTLLPNPITEAVENQYTQLWETRRSAANITVGVVAPAI